LRREDVREAELRQIESLYEQCVALEAQRLLSDEEAPWEVARRVMWMTLLAGSFLFYYLIDRMHYAITLL
jgi:hypothetical protein